MEAHDHPGPWPSRDAFNGKAPRRQPQRGLDRRLEDVAEAVGGGYCRWQMPLRPALAVRRIVAGHRLGALEGGGGGFQYIPALGPHCSTPHRIGLSHIPSSCSSLDLLRLGDRWVRLPIEPIPAHPCRRPLGISPWRPGLRSSRPPPPPERSCVVGCLVGAKANKLRSGTHPVEDTWRQGDSGWA